MKHKHGNMQPVSIIDKVFESLAKIIIGHGCIRLVFILHFEVGCFPFYSKVWTFNIYRLRRFVFFLLLFASASAFLFLLLHSKMLLSMQNSDSWLLLLLSRSCPNLVQRERKDEKQKKKKHDEPKTNIYMYKVMYTIYSNTFQNRQTLKSLAKISIYFFSQPLLGNLLYLDCTIYVYMSNHEGPKQQK